MIIRLSVGSFDDELLETVVLNMNPEFELDDVVTAWILVWEELVEEEEADLDVARDPEDGTDFSV